PPCLCINGNTQLVCRLLSVINCLTDPATIEYPSTPARGERMPHIQVLELVVAALATILKRSEVVFIDITRAICIKKGSLGAETTDAIDGRAVILRLLTFANVNACAQTHTLDIFIALLSQALATRTFPRKPFLCCDRPDASCLEPFWTSMLPTLLRGLYSHYGVLTGHKALGIKEYTKDMPHVRGLPLRKMFGPAGLLCGITSALDLHAYPRFGEAVLDSLVGSRKKPKTPQQYLNLPVFSNQPRSEPGYCTSRSQITSILSLLHSLSEAKRGRVLLSRGSLLGPSVMEVVCGCTSYENAFPWNRKIGGKCQLMIASILSNMVGDPQAWKTVKENPSLNQVMCTLNIKVWRDAVQGQGGECYRFNQEFISLDNVLRIVRNEYSRKLRERDNE
ncbi:hypothetical protein KIPB_003064, partial [Kipferlia bialata]